MLEAGAMELRDQLAGRFPWRLAGGGQRRQRAHPGQPLHQDRGAIVHAFAPVVGGERQRHRQLLLAQRAQQAELGEAAHAVDAAPQVAVAAQAGGPAAAQVLAQQRAALAGFDEPGAAAAAFGDRLRSLAPVRRREPGGVGLPQLRAVEQNRPVAARIAEWRQVFVGVEARHQPSLAST